MFTGHPCAPGDVINYLKYFISGSLYTTLGGRWCDPYFADREAGAWECQAQAPGHTSHRWKCSDVVKKSGSGQVM